MKTHARAAVLSLVLFGCSRAAPPPTELTRAQDASVSPAAADAKRYAPQAFARAELLKQRAERAHEEGSDTAAKILADQALAAYTRATIEARLTRAEARLAEAKALASTASKKLADLDAEQARLTAETADLELQVKVARDAEPVPKNQPANPERERARKEAARAMTTQALLLCVSARLIEPNRASVGPLLQKAESLGERLAAPSSAPAPIDEATALRSDCLRELTLARRPRVQASPARGEADALLSELSRADLLPFRDDRGVVVTLRGLTRDATGRLTAEARKRVEELGRIAQQHADFPVLVVTHSGGGKAAGRDAAKETELGAAVAEALKAGGAARVESRGAGTTEPVVPPNRTGAAARNERVEVVFVAPGG